MSESRNGVTIISSRLTELGYDINGEEFSRWSERQRKVFSADVTNNIETGRLKSLKRGDPCIKAFASVLGKIDYTPILVTNDPTDEADVVQAGVTGDETSRGDFLRQNGINTNGPDFGWLTLEDKQSIGIKPTPLQAPSRTTA